MGSDKAKRAVVTEIQDLAPRVRCIRIAGNELKGIDWTPGQKVKLKVDDWSRSYTPARVDSEAGWMDIVFFLHGNGSASQWAAGVVEGERVRFNGPVNSMPGPEGTPDWALFLGDETAIGLAAALLEALPGSVNVLGAIELDEIDSHAVEAFGLPLTAAIRTEVYGESLLHWLQSTELPDGEGMVWISGEAMSALALRQVLKSRSLERVRCKTKAYWSCKGHAHRKALEKHQLVA